MKVTCLYNIEDYLTKATEEIFNLVIKKEYIVYGICKLQSGELTYLILGERENMPSWYPAELFKISDALQPIEWYCAEHRHVKDTTIDYIWGHTTEKRKLYVKEYFYILLRNKNTEKMIFPVFLFLLYSIFS
ncbi:hypothetical protein [Bacillus cereus]|uniref:hypothetical protein n=1 Tax=Bacillus cereus TaxID=1396 RepID=UPI0020D2899D|nr:hypothetical protein [Bacillus cereus]